MAFRGFGNNSGPSGFGKNSGPSATPGVQNPFENLTRPPSHSFPRPISTRSSVDYRDLDASKGIFSPPLDSSQPFPGTNKSNGPPLRWDDVKASSFNNHGDQYHQPSTLLPQVAANNFKIVTNTRKGEVQPIKRTNSSYAQSPDESISRNIMYRPPYGARSPPPVFQNSQYVAGQHPHREKVQQRPFSPVWVNQSNISNHNTTPPAQHSGQAFQTKHVDGSLPSRTRSPTFLSTSGASPQNTRSDGHKRSLIDYRDLDAPEDLSSPPLAFNSSSSMREYSRPFASNQNMFADQSEPSINYASPLVHNDMPSALTTRGTYQSGRKPEMEHADVQLPKRARSPRIIPPISRGSPQNPAIVSDGPKRALDFQNRSQSPSWQRDGTEAAANKPMEFPAVKRTKIPLQSSPDIVSEENLDPAQEIERELQAKAKRLARFKDELSQPVQDKSIVKNQKDPAKRQQQKNSEDPKMDKMVDSTGGNVLSDYENVASSSSIVGLCPDMCPEPERAERERKGDLDQYERVDGDRNLTSEFLAVKKYTRTAEREPELIRPMPILQKSMDYLLNLLDGPYDDRFLGLYNFLWDRMRAIRMDLRMQHIFNLEAIRLLEQMIRLHVIAMHELCEYTKGEGFSEGFDAHLNIEQMNKTSVELFQLYDDHRKRGIRVPSEREFRGYYALLKLDKHPGYKVEPAELSLDLAKMTPEMRQTPQVLFARNVARACRMGNFIAFFRLARKASYLQACLMHAHFSKLRTQALASLHCGLQINQGIPITQVSKWLGMEEEDIGELLEYYGFSVKDFEEPYMVKENAFLNVDNDFPVKRSELVERKRSKMIVADVSYPSLTESCADNKEKEFQLKKIAEPPPKSVVPISTPQVHDEEMHDMGPTLSPKSTIQKPINQSFIFPTTPDNRTVGVEVKETPSGPLVPDFFNSVSEHHQISIKSAKKPMFESAFRNSFSTLKKHDFEATAAVAQETAVTQTTAEEKGDPDMPLDSVVYTPSPQPMSTEDLGVEELAEIVEEDIPDEMTSSNYDKEVVEAKLKLILRIWKRRTMKKRILREHRQFTANAALDFLSLGPPMWQLEEQPGNFGTFNIDHIMSQRHEVQERSYSVLNPSDVIATKLVEKNPDANCLCWKLVLCSQEETLQNEATGSWLRSKLIPANVNGADDLIVSSPDLAIWRSWIPTQSDVDTCCLSVIKSTKLEDVNKSLIGANAVLFLLSEHIPLDLQKKCLHDLVAVLASGSQLPILILTGSCKDDSNLSNVAGVLELHNIEKSRVTISFLKGTETKEMDGFFSDERLREGLEWLACESPPQIVVTRTKTRERVLSHLNTTMEILDQDSHRVHPNHCISAFNESLDRLIKEVAETAHANPSGWPCPEIDLLEESSDEHRAVAWYLPSVGWSSSSRTQSLMSALNDSKLPGFEDNLSWLSRGLSSGDDIGKLKSHLENCLVDYLSETSRMMRRGSAQNEASIMLQSCTLLELRNTTYYITPRWVPIFRRIFSWRLMQLNSGEASSMYLLPNHCSATPSSEVTFYVVQPSFDELVEAGCCPTSPGSNPVGSNDMNHYDDVPSWSPIPSDVLMSNLVGSNDMNRDDDVPSWSPIPSDVLMSNGDIVSTENEEMRAQDGVLTSYDHSGKEKSSKSMVVRAARSRTEADKLSELLEKCNIVQNQIDEKLSIYF